MSHDSFLEDITQEPIAATARYYASRLNEHDKILDYLKRQTLFDPSETLGIGFSDRTLGKQLLEMAVRKGATAAAKNECFGSLKGGHLVAWFRG